MAHPKRKISKSRRDKRRTHHKLDLAAVAVCSNCGVPVVRHRICNACGFYRNKKAVEKTVEA
jgi:large subunit ribosomal protein L32